MLTCLAGALFLLLREFGIKSVRSGPYRPQSQGLFQPGNKTVKQKIYAGQNDHDGSPCWSRSLLDIFLSITTSLSYSNHKTPYDVVLRHSFVSSPWSLTQAEHEEEAENEVDATDILSENVIARVEQLLDQSNIQEHEDDVIDGGKEGDFWERFQ